MKTTRRRAMAGGLAGALAVPTLEGLPSWRWAHGEGSVLLFDPSLEAGRRFAEAGRAAGGRVQALKGDSIRLAMQVLRDGPAFIAGVSRHADALLFAEAAAETGYRRVTSLRGANGRCTIDSCHDGWEAIGRFAEAAGPDWIEALAMYASRPAAALPHAAAPAIGRLGEAETALAWVLARR